MSENNSRKVFDSLVSRTKIYLVIILILFILISVFRPILIIPSIILYISILCYTYFANNKRKSEISEQLQDLTLTVDSAAKSSLINSPFPLVILETNGNIVWKSSKFVTEFADIDMDNYIDDLIIDIKDEIEKSDNKKRKSVIRQIQIGKKTYTVQGEFAKSKKYERKKSPEYMMILYFIDETEKVKLKQENEDKKICVGIIMIDNYEEVTQRVDAEQKTQLMAKVESTIYDWVNETNGILVKADRDTYVYVFEQKNLEKIKEEKFAILDSIKNLVRKDKIQLTLSIAISNEGDTERDVYKSASAAMDVILGRGGDQAVIRQNGKYLFFGGKVEEVEKRTKVKARIVAHALEELIKENDKIMIMGHTNPDIDAIGSALGIYRIAKTLEKEAKIVANVETPSIKDLYESIKDQYQEVFISSETALAQVDSGTLIIVVDTHKKTYVESPELLTKTNKIVKNMGAFGIYVAILTFIYIVYYAAMIGMDVVGSNGKKKAEVEEFAVGNAPNEDFEEEPTMVSEDDDTPAVKTGETEVLSQPSTGENALMATSGKSEEQLAAEILAADDNALYNQSMAVKKKMVKFCAESEDEKTAREYERSILESMEQAVELGGNNMDDLDV